MGIASKIQIWVLNQKILDTFSWLTEEQSNQGQSINGWFLDDLTHIRWEFMLFMCKKLTLWDDNTGRGYASALNIAVPRSIIVHKEF